jgi:hypothetical protein
MKILEQSTKTVAAKWPRLGLRRQSAAATALSGGKEVDKQLKVFRRATAVSRSGSWKAPCSFWDLLTGHEPWQLASS